MSDDSRTTLAVLGCCAAGAQFGALTTITLAEYLDIGWRDSAGWVAGVGAMGWLAILTWIFIQVCRDRPHPTQSEVNHG